MSDAGGSERSNVLYYGDNLDVLRRYVEPESIDLVYLDPPFKSNQDYNVLFAERSGEQAASQIKAFEDTWHWDKAAAFAFQETVEMGGGISQALQAFRTFLGESDMLAYLAMMAPRLVELRRVLKDTGSLYLHCDPTSGHYLKVLLDAVFGPGNFKSEIIWKRTNSHNSAKRYGPVHDIILFYVKGPSFVWHEQRVDYDERYVREKFGKIDPKTQKRFQDVTLTGPGTREGPSGQPWRGFDPTVSGRHWQPASYIYDKYERLTGKRLDAFPLTQRLDRLDAAGLIYWPKKEGGWPRYMEFLEDAPGLPLQDLWTDIEPINSQARERLGYPTQKPEALLERIIKSSSDEGGVVLDPFCGCGTAVAAAEKLRRQWVGIDVTYLAIGLIKHRLSTAFGGHASFKVVGEPVSLPDAQQLAVDAPYQFQFWALDFVGARPTEEKKGADKGIDGRLYFHEKMGGETKQIVFSVKAGKLHATYVRDLRGVLEREGAAIAVLISMHEPTKQMRTEAASAGFYKSQWGNHPRLQLITVEELIDGKRIDAPPASQTSVTLKRAPRAKRDTGVNLELPLVASGDPPSYSPRRRR
jgi:DNA modification methylase